MSRESSDNFLNDPFEDAAPPASDFSDAGRQTSPFRVPSVEEIITILTQNNAAEHEFSSETEQYRVESSLQRNNRRWVYRSTVYHNTVQMMDGEFGPEELRKEAFPEEWKWESFVKEAAEKHREKCRRLSALVAVKNVSGPDKLWWKKLLKIILMLFVIGSLAFNLLLGYFYWFDRQGLAGWLGISVSSDDPGPPEFPELKIRCVADRAQEEIELVNNTAKLTLKKTDTLKISVEEKDRDDQPPVIRGSIHLKFID